MRAHCRSVRTQVRDTHQAPRTTSSDLRKQALGRPREEPHRGRRARYRHHVGNIDSVSARCRYGSYAAAPNTIADVSPRRVHSKHLLHRRDTEIGSFMWGAGIATDTASAVTEPICKDPCHCNCGKPVRQSDLDQGERWRCPERANGVTVYLGSTRSPAPISAYTSTVTVSGLRTGSYYSFSITETI